MNSGFGICGHKNSYSSGVKVGNFVEDQIGRDLAKSSQPHQFAATSESQDSYADPATIQRNESDNISTTSFALENQLVRQGLSYQMIFAHGPGIEVDPESQKESRWITTNSIQFNEACERCPRNNKKARELHKKTARDQRCATSYMTTARANSSLLTK